MQAPSSAFRVQWSRYSFPSLAGRPFTSGYRMIKKFVNKARKLAKVLVHSDYRSAFLKSRVAAAVEHEGFLRSLDCRTVVDIGANGGQFALASRHCFPDARIISFEPLPKAAARFQATLGGDSRVTLHCAAVGVDVGDATMHVTAEDDSSSLLSVTALQTSLFSGSREVATDQVRVDHLDKFIHASDLHPPAILKIDVQGYELSTLKGCQSLLHQFAYVYVESSFMELYEGQALADEVVAYLQQMGFQLTGVYDIYYDHTGKAVQADLSFSQWT